MNGSAGGETGPAVFLPDGKKIHIAYTYYYLIRRGDADGPKIAMTDIGYMTLEAWE